MGGTTNTRTQIMVTFSLFGIAYLELTVRKKKNLIMESPPDLKVPMPIGFVLEKTIFSVTASASPENSLIALIFVEVKIGSIMRASVIVNISGIPRSQGCMTTRQGIAKSGNGNSLAGEPPKGVIKLEQSVPPNSVHFSTKSNSVLISLLIPSIKKLTNF